jgi:hypothetical protein
MRGPSTSAKTEMWNPGGAFSWERSKRVFSARAKSACARNERRRESRANDGRRMFNRRTFGEDFAVSFLRLSKDAFLE